MDDVFGPGGEVRAFGGHRVDVARGGIGSERTWRELVGKKAGEAEASHAHAERPSHSRRVWGGGAMCMGRTEGEPLVRGGGPTDTYCPWTPARQRATPQKRRMQ